MGMMLTFHGLTLPSSVCRIVRPEFWILSRGCCWKLVLNVLKMVVSQWSPCQTAKLATSWLFQCEAVCIPVSRGLERTCRDSRVYPLST